MSVPVWQYTKININWYRQRRVNLWIYFEWAISYKQAKIASEVSLETILHV